MGTSYINVEHNLEWFPLLGSRRGRNSDRVYYWLVV